MPQSKRRLRGVLLVVECIEKVKVELSRSYDTKSNPDFSNVTQSSFLEQIQEQ